MKKRYLIPHILRDLNEKMVFIGGARQVGKTSLAKYIAENYFKHYDYLNWDARDDRKNILQSQFKGNAEIILFDEIHKYKDWKNYLKGQFDKHKDDFKVLVTGSARLDVYRRGGDSLLGRYYYYRLHPFSAREALGKSALTAVNEPLQFLSSGQSERSLLEALFTYGGFPEPFLSQDEETARRFRADRVERLIREDIRDLEQVRDLSGLQVLQHILPQKVGSLFSIQSLQEDLSVAHKTASLWVDIFERMYYLFRLQPFSPSLQKSERRQPKVYLWDWAEVIDQAVRFENLVASHLLKFVHLLHDASGHKAELFFYRDREGREVDFVVAIDRVPWFAGEGKLDDASPSKALRHVKEKFSIPYAYQVVWGKGVKEATAADGTLTMSAEKFLSALV